MATTITKTITFASSDFAHIKPAFDPETSIKGLKYAWSGVTIGSFSTDYGYITGLTITFNGTAPFAAVSFQSPPPIMSPFSVGKDGINGLFVPFDGSPLPFYGLVLENGVPNNPYIIVNGDQNNVTDKLEVLLSVGVKYDVDPGVVNSITVSYVCNPPVPIYSVYTGLHVYSPYDSINTPKLHTYLYSKVNPLSWEVGTRVWCSAWFDKVSPQYYYGYDINNKVYKVGGPLDRSFGVKKIYKVVTSAWRSLRHKKPKINTVIDGPKTYSYPADDTIDACVNVILSRAGIISEIIDKVSIPQPQKYKYWMGYHLTDKQTSNDNFFTKWAFNEEKFYPITGYMHMLYKLSEGYFRSIFLDTGIAGNFGDLETMVDKYAMLAAAGFSIAFTLVWWIINFKTVLSFMPELFIGTNSGWLFASIGASSLTPLGLLVAAAMVLMLLWSLFSKKRKTVVEGCKIFLGEYTTTPYIELTSSLSRVIDMSQQNLGYYCDGVYFYTQAGLTPSVTVKELSSTNALVNEDPLQQEFKYSVSCDDPTTVVALDKLLLLPYTSGMPLEYPEGTIWYSEAIPRIVTLPADCAELLITPPTSEYTLPAGYCFSFISQDDANDKAAAIAENSIDHMVSGPFKYGEVLSEANLGVLDCYFTHEIRVETTPTICTLFYNNTDQLGDIPGRKVYFDIEGRFPAINGFYAIDGTGGNFRKFYKIENNVITNMYTMVSSSSTTVQGNPGVLSVNTVNLGFSSNWYIQSPSVVTISNIVNLIPRCLDTNTLAEYNYVVRGYYDSTNLMFYLYADNYTHYTISEAPANWYLPLIEWIDEKAFEYSPHLSINIDIEEICLPATAYENALYGFYVIGSSGGNICPLYNQVNLTVRVYVGPTLKHTYTVITNESGKTYVPYGTYVAIIDDVTSIVITSINGANPIGNITYTIGTFTSCSGCVTTDPFATGLQACWNFEDASVPVVDSTGNHNLTSNNNVIYHQVGKIGSYAIAFNTSTSYLQGDTGLNLAPTMSISVWVKVVGVTSYNRYIYDKEGVALYIQSGGKPVFGIINGNTENSTVADVNVNDGTWHHIVATMDTTILKVCMYVDGVPDLFNPHTASFAPDYGDNSTPITIGNASILSYFALYGLLDGLAVWNRVLTPCEVKTLYNSGSGLACI